MGEMRRNVFFLRGVKIVRKYLQNLPSRLALLLLVADAVIQSLQPGPGGRQKKCLERQRVVASGECGSVGDPSGL